ncbi:hypothetical protein B0T24DRAFT_668230 [Lasiosphaeria ovina]|uniref:Uncharacterized protein n=1 Tax=Lasiosphaeria ovina TaxID=92902 RepID=A0AAE0N6U8_9PEZI|nr:hypothetical protein B0T24DRAFT_668230 [Lasiosphaeria ovina]
MLTPTETMPTPLFIYSSTRDRPICIYSLDLYRPVLDLYFFSPLATRIDKHLSWNTTLVEDGTASWDEHGTPLRKDEKPSWAKEIADMLNTLSIQPRSGAEADARDREMAGDCLTEPKLLVVDTDAAPISKLTDVGGIEFESTLHPEETASDLASNLLEADGPKLLPKLQIPAIYNDRISAGSDISDIIDSPGDSSPLAFSTGSGTLGIIDSPGDETHSGAEHEYNQDNEHKDSDSASSQDWDELKMLESLKRLRTNADRCPGSAFDWGLQASATPLPHEPTESPWGSTLCHLSYSLIHHITTIS